ncbi:MAG TPA: hypothetical protein VFO16_20175 [Pseudonocardiaceae bacterium]|nr:hypothetical protein [Pseudonocardiaceae bacterium]
MTLYLVNYFSTPGLVLLVVGGATALAIIVSVIVRAADSFPYNARRPIKQAAGEYVHAVVEDEWPSLRRGEGSPRASAALEGIYVTVSKFEPRTEVEKAFYASAVEDLHTVTNAASFCHHP